ncbi:MAG: hypothetical protein AUK47_22745 [Deltaproteobacteria bacterium CG2_30_63_29]|nr:MAG: hypothetical protein AUK47_22745 [Deltaproteobacteria bacterium CG2_30_63_29]
MTVDVGSLALEITGRCNRNCVYCYNDWRARPRETPDELKTATLLELVASVLRATGVRRLTVTGGEPLARPDALDLLAGLVGLGLELSLVSDGGLIDEAMANALAALPVSLVQVTLLAANRESHDALKGTPSFDATLRALAHLKRASVRTSVAFVCTRRNAQHFRDVIELCFALGVKDLAFSRFCATGRGGREDELSPTHEQLERCLELADEANARFGMRVHLAIGLPRCAVDVDRLTHLKLGRCALSSARPGLTLGANGELRGCSVSSLVLGELTREPIAAVLARAEVDFFPAVRAVPEACQGCEWVGDCGGGCRESARNRGGLEQPDPLARPA